MSADSNRVAASVLAMLTKRGRDVTRRAYSAGTYDTATGLVTPTTADTTRKGYRSDFGAGKTTERGTLIQVGDKKLLLDASAAIAQQDHFIISGTEYIIVSFGEIEMDDAVVAYDVHLRNG